MAAVNYENFSIIRNSTMVDNTSYTIVQQHPGRFVLFCGIVLVSLFSFFGNGIAAWIFSRKVFQSPINVLIVGLALSDFVFSLLSCTVSFPFGLYYVTGDIQTFLPAQTYVTIYMYPLAMMSRTTSIWTMMLITVERFLAVCYPLKAKFHFTRRFAVNGFAAIAVASVLYNLCRFWEYESVHNAQLNVTAFVPLLRDNEVYTTIHTLWLDLLLLYALPFAILTTLNIKTICGLKAAAKKRKEIIDAEQYQPKTLRPSPSVPIMVITDQSPKKRSVIQHCTKAFIRNSPNNLRSSVRNPHRSYHSFGNMESSKRELRALVLKNLQRNAAKRSASQNAAAQSKRTESAPTLLFLPFGLLLKTEQKITTMMLVIIVVFLCCNLLPCFMAVMEVMVFNGLQRVDEQWFYVATDLTNLLVSVNSAYCFIVYYVYCQKFRVQIKKFFRRRLKPISGNNKSERKLAMRSFQTDQNGTRLVVKAKTRSRSECKGTAVAIV